MILNFERSIREEIPGMTLLVNESMSRHTSFKIGGPAALLAAPASVDELVDLRFFAAKHGIRAEIIGNGSNLLVADEGIDALVITTKYLDGMALAGNKITAAAGVTLSKLSSFAKSNSLTGLEFAHGIPGTVGGGVVMNAGAYGEDISGVLISSTACDSKGNIFPLSRDEHNFSYRHSVFTEHPDYILLESVFELSPGSYENINNKIRELSEKRKKSQPLEYPSAGSVFKRPAGYFAGELVERAGLKGFKIGGAQVSEKHAGFIINKGGATFKDVTFLIDHIKTTVLQKFGVALECEIISLR